VGRHGTRVEVPGWLVPLLDAPPVLPRRPDRMRLAVDLARENVHRGSGGPFGALVVASETGQVVSAGVNLVVASHNSTAHAEMLALQLAEASLRTYDLGSAPGGPYELVTSVEPCVMCLGAVLWSGVTTLVCGARDEDAHAIGFDEGPKPVHWVDRLGGRGIGVVLDLLREESAAVLAEYRAGGGEVYNASRPLLTAAR
jgi:tRNA(Arg) A34 adenosine deaminase TadA